LNGELFGFTPSMCQFEDTVEKPSSSFVTTVQNKWKAAISKMQTMNEPSEWTGLVRLCACISVVKKTIAHTTVKEKARLKESRKKHQKNKKQKGLVYKGNGFSQSKSGMYSSRYQ
jgi:hypothetical protein